MVMERRFQEFGRATQTAYQRRSMRKMLCLSERKGFGGGLMGDAIG